jgi:hypothetical protein
MLLVFAFPGSTSLSEISQTSLYCSKPPYLFPFSLAALRTMKLALKKAGLCAFLVVERLL